MRGSDVALSTLKFRILTVASSFMRRLRSRPPHVTFEIQDASALGSGLPYVGRLYLRQAPIAEVALESADLNAGKKALLKLVSSEAPQVPALVEAFQSTFGWSLEASLALAVGFATRSGIVPPRVVGWRYAGKRGRGRPKASDHITHQVFRLLQGWWYVMDRRPSPHAETVFTQALIAAAPILPILNRQGAVVSEWTIHELIRQEWKKLMSPDFVLVSPSEVVHPN